MKKKYDLSIIIVNYKSDSLLWQCLKSIQRYLKIIKFEIIIVSNSKIEIKYKKLIRNIKTQKKIIELKNNIGFPAANNVGRKFTHSDFILMLNPDTLFIDESFLKMFSYFREHKNIGIIGPKLIDANNRQQSSFFTNVSLLSIVADEFYLSKFKIFAFHYYYYKKFKMPQKVDSLSGACMLTRSKYLSKKYLLDEKLFWIEDDEICLRMKAKGYDVIYYPNTTIIHYGDKNNKKASKIKIFNQYLGKIKLFQKYKKYFSVKFLKIFFFFIFQIKKIIFFLSKNEKEKLAIYTELGKEIFKVKYDD